MPGHLSDIVDLARKTYLADESDHPQFHFVPRLQAYPFWEMFLSDGLPIGGGASGIRGKLNLARSGTAGHTRPWAVNAPTVPNLTDEIRIDWQYLQDDYSVERHELLELFEQRRIGLTDVEGMVRAVADLVKIRREDCIHNMAELVEDEVFTAPYVISPSDESEDHLYGLPYWFVKITAAQVTSGGGQTAICGDFQGGLPAAQDGTDFTSVAGIDPTATGKDLWKSWNETWDASDGSISDNDLQRMDNGFLMLNFKPPVKTTDYSATLFKLRMYAGRVTLLNYKKRRRQSNDQIGMDLAGPSGAVFNNVPIQHVPILNTSTNANGNADYPLYFHNGRYLFPLILKGDNMRESTIPGDRDQHDVATTYINLTGNLKCTSRREAGGVISYIAAA